MSPHRALFKGTEVCSDGMNCVIGLDSFHEGESGFIWGVGLDLSKSLSACRRIGEDSHLGEGLQARVFLIRPAWGVS